LFFVASKILDILLAPLTWVMIALVVVAIRVRPKTRAELKTKKLVFFAPIVAVLALYTLSLKPVANALKKSLESSAVTTMKDGETYDAAIVLSGMVDLQSTGEHGPTQLNDNVERILVTFDLLREGRVKNVLITGEHEAQMLADLIAKWGIARERIVLEERAKNTRENATFSAPIVRERGWTKLLLVTSAFHMKRAAGCFRAAGLTFDTKPVDWRTYGARGSFSPLPRTDAFNDSTDAIREHAGWLVYRMQGYAVP
jgi:uncharacterized SAM-binding protein YcdF (DUF218 family)